MRPPIIIDQFIVDAIHAFYSTYGKLSGPDGINILQQLYPEGTPMHPEEGRMAAFCPETADVVHDFLRTGKLAPISPEHGYRRSDSFYISSQDVLQLANGRRRNQYVGNRVGNWQTPPNHSIQRIPEPQEPHWVHVPPPPREPRENASEREIEIFNEQVDRRNALVDQFNQQVEDFRIARLRYYTETIAAPSPNDVDEILNSIKTYIKTRTLMGQRYHLGHVVVHGIRNNRLNIVNRNDHTQHFFVIMLFFDEIYLVDAMLGYKVNKAVFTNESTQRTYEGLSEEPGVRAIDARGPIVTKDMNIIRSYFRFQNFRNIRYTLTFDAIRTGNVRRNAVQHELQLGVPDYATAIEPGWPDGWALFQDTLYNYHLPIY